MNFKKETENTIINHFAFFNAIGFFSEIIIFIIVACLLFSQTYFFVVYLIAFIINIVINKVLKNTLQEPRPANSQRFLASEHFFKKAYGMPSGHTQNAFFSLSYYFFVTQNTNLSLWYVLALVTGVIAIWQRISFRNHTLLQCLGGVGVGILVGFSVYHIALFVSERGQKKSFDIVTE
jgi:membrane-associated phospholipid phosphatase